MLAGIGALIGGGAALYGALKSRSDASAYNAQTFSNNLAIAKLQNQWYKENSQIEFERQKQLIADQNAYNSPEAQMTRLKAAGLNPNLVYGSVSSGNQSSAGTAPNSQTPNIQVPGFKYVSKSSQLASVIGAIGNTLTDIYNLRKEQQAIALNQMRVMDDINYKSKQIDLQQQRNDISQERNALTAEKNRLTEKSIYNQMQQNKIHNDFLASQWATNARYQYEAAQDRKAKFNFETQKAGYVKGADGSYQKKNWWLRLLDNVFGSKYF